MTGWQLALVWVAVVLAAWAALALVVFAAYGVYLLAT